jgi:hypothetical protein
MFNFLNHLQDTEESNFAAEWLALLLRIRNVPGSHPETVYFWRFSQSLEANARMVPQVSSRPVPSTTSPIYYSVIILPFEVI